ncbi:MAG: 2-C-methyl-D-erythritol 4-phosphate cytidylyltransferase [Desulfurivibrionaceae bacterium]|nr:2-C-methyl-D-erythritol 4-phosphate cytidylyltransferase [Desulfurivibrionaceae bacterium]
MNIAIIPAGGLGSRMGLALPKQYCELLGVPLLVHTLRAFEATPAIDGVIVVVPGAHLQATRALVAEHGLRKVRQVVAGGGRRQDSVASGLAVLPAGTEFIVVHDGARPLVTPELISRCLQVAREQGAALAALAVKDTLKDVEVSGVIRSTVDRSALWQAQTPQVMRPEVLRRAMALVGPDFIGTDEAAFLEAVGEKMVVVEGSERNIKITRPEDLQLAAALLQTDQNMDTMDHKNKRERIGHGYDAHALVAGRDLVLGGVVIAHERGLLGHSDADVLTHALCDAILGALGLGDIGRHFPDSEPAYAGISSLRLLEEVMALARGKGYRLGNADITVIAQQPKLAPHWAAMQENLGQICQVAASQLNLKGTTTEKMGFAGRGEGIAAHAVVLMLPHGQDS